MRLEEIIRNILLGYNNFSLFFLIFINVVNSILLLLALRGIRMYRQKRKSWPYKKMISSVYVPPVSILVPSFNEERTIVDNIESLLAIEYSQFEVVVINDGSKDNTLDTLIKAFGLKKMDSPYKKDIYTEEVRGIYISSTRSNLKVVDKVNGGKADALNAGINVARYPLFTAIDADSILEKNSLLKVVRPFIDNPEKVVATGGIVRVLNGSKVVNGFIEEVGLSKKALPTMQTIEYLRAFLFGRMGWSELGSLLIVSGAFGVFKKSVVLKVGGYTQDTIGEDMELILKIHRLMRREKKEYEIVFIPDPVCWTQAPEDLKSLRGQRIRWHRGLMDSLYNCRGMLLNPKYGIIGLVALPYYFLVEMLGPVVEIIGYLSVIGSFFLGILNVDFAILYFTFSVLYGIFLSVTSVMLEEYNFMKYDKVTDYIRMIIFAVIENFGYRQLTTWWRLRAFFGYRRKKNQWGNIERKEFSSKAA
ncbi:glycosyltransferase [Proteiniclasticum sp.]|uniref:glycosyltransferase family 2 protein n=1 Tax=Proteiniclasticum sp. TaxID=2053595 RepID=UPI0028A0D0BF|nr:glycosyltransferase [Proteiniclasticum sp.]